MKLKVLVKREGRADRSADFEGAPKGESLLDELEEHGIKIPYGCRAGSCGVCRVLVEEGMGALDSPGVIEEDTLARIPGTCKELRLSCRAALKADATGTLVLVKPKDSEEE